jgi:hypothetical protein
MQLVDPLFNKSPPSRRQLICLDAIEPRRAMRFGGRRER